MKINILRLIIRYHQFKILLLCISLLIVYTTLRYTHIYTTFDVLSKHEIKDNLVYTETNEFLCPLNFYSSSYILYPSLKLSENDNWTDGLYLNSGEWYPTHCTSPFRVAIIIPYRNRLSHLQIFLRYMHKFLQKQNLHYKIYVIEQVDQNKFNRGKLLNIGYVEALKEYDYPCFIFHDVDLLPQSLNNIYACTKYPRHMASNIDKYRYNLPYDRYFGGAISILNDQFKALNGFSNIFYGWGGEDDDFFNRVRKLGLRVIRFSPYISRYFSLPHDQAEPSPERFKKMSISELVSQLDGLKSLYYHVKKKVQLSSHVKISVTV